ncbi:hypothetical protein ANN_15574 [Periplaneta americana]|uniref:Uncharacterized protein n=1 Tax=Periplaneta americana TaxID=6978 RepID=A0ABQ8SGR1_PERAM|nr:hypothetical protein ANN_15574 [Periplaneta americana]
MRFLRSLTRVTLRDRIRSEDIRNQWEVEEMTADVQHYQPGDGMFAKGQLWSVPEFCGVERRNKISAQVVCGRTRATALGKALLERSEQSLAGGDNSFLNSTLTSNLPLSERTREDAARNTLRYR